MVHKYWDVSQTLFVKREKMMGDRFIDNEFANYYGDSRLLYYLKYDKSGNYMCIYCGEKADSREHIPSKILLDEPYPSKLAVLPSCKSCNNSFSSDEQYVACLIEYVKSVLNNAIIDRKKISQTFQKRPHILKGFEHGTKCNDDGSVEYIEYDIQKIESVVIKLAKCHAMYTMSQITFDTKAEVYFRFLPELVEGDIAIFTQPVIQEKSPELGARGAIEILLSAEGNIITPWNIVQEGRYRFITFVADKGSVVRIVISEYFCAEVFFPDDK
jgi:hypothetical protein